MVDEIGSRMLTPHGCSTMQPRDRQSAGKSLPRYLPYQALSLPISSPALISLALYLSWPKTPLFTACLADVAGSRYHAVMRTPWRLLWPSAIAYLESWSLLSFLEWELVPAHYRFVVLSRALSTAFL